WLAQERPAGRFTRQLALGRDIDMDAIHATYENGVLSPSIPIADRAKPRKIAVEHSAGPRQSPREHAPAAVEASSGAAAVLLPQVRPGAGGARGAHRGSRPAPSRWSNTRWVSV